MASLKSTRASSPAAAGLFNESVPLAQLEARVSDVAQKLLKKNLETLKASKDAVRRTMEMTYDNAKII